MPRVVCCTMFSPSHSELAELSVPNLQWYCKRHGYEMMLIEIENDKWEYKKHEAFKRWMDNNDADLIWYRDVDSVITNLSIPITDFVDDYNSFYLTKDFNELNGGSVIIKNTMSGRCFNDLVLEHRDRFENEQNFYNSIPMLTLGKDMMKQIQHPSINSYQYSLYPECSSYVGKEFLGDWKEGNFVLHVPALPMQKRIEILKNTPIIK